MSVSNINVVVPLSGDGPIANISSLNGSKTVILTGRFLGRYVLLGSHNGINFTPVMKFDSNGEECIKQILDLSLDSVRLRSEAQSPVGVSLNISGVSTGSINHFTTLGTLAVGASGLQPIIDLNTIFAPTGLEQDINFICVGGFSGSLVIRGSRDGFNFTPMASFQLGNQNPSLLGSGPQTFQFTPIATKDLIRYVQLDVLGVITSPTVITYGGANPTTSGAVGSSSLSQGSDRLSSSNDTEVIIFEEMINLDNVGVIGDPITLTLQGIGHSSAAAIVGTVRAYLGATSPGDTTGGVVRGSATFNNAAPDAAWIGTGAPFLNPGGRRLLQITLQSNTPLTTVYARGYTVGVA